MRTPSLRWSHVLPLAALLALPLARPAAAEEPAPAPAPAPASAGLSTVPAELRAKAEAALAKGAALLKSVQAEDGSFGDPEIKLPGSVGYTAMAAAALVGAAPPSLRDSDAALSRALGYLVRQQKDNGAIYSNDRFVTYETSAAISALALARRAEHRAAQGRARDFLASTQIAGDAADPSYGGFPYKSKTPQAADLSNLQFAVDALARGELPADSPVWQRVQSYLKRVQNRSETNTETRELPKPGGGEGEKVKVVSGDDGGGYYAPDQSKADMRPRPDGTYELVSYGSMTYALLKCLLLAGVDPADSRALAALAWLSSRFTLERNPGFEGAKDPAKAGMQGYYYFLFTAARTLDLYERATKKPLVVRDGEGRERAWRAELAEKLLSLQREDGGWRNEAAERWDEGSRTLATAYALQALATALGRLD